MSGYTFFLGMVAGVALLAIPLFALDGPEGIATWVASRTEPEVRSTATSVPLGQLRPQSGFVPGDPTPTPIPLPNIPAPGETPEPAPVPTMEEAVASAPDEARAVDAPHCAPEQAPGFVLGFAELRQQVGDAMGAAIECEHTNPESGDRVQRTTTGMAVYSPSSGLTRFTDGWRHWALTPGGVVAWEGADATPPPEVAGVTAELREGAEEAEGERMRVVNTDGLGVVFRNSPNLEDRQTRGLLEGQVATVLERQGDEWLRVRAPNGVEGWVPAQYLAPEG